MLARSSPSQGHAQTLPARIYGSHCPIPMSSTAPVWFLLTIFHQWVLSCVLASLPKIT